jgi:tetratricopeptide (TPR) repeat protein
MKLAECYYNIGDFDNAEIECVKTLRIYPDHSNALNIRGMIAYRKGDLVKAFRIFKSNFKKDPQNVVACFFIAQIYFDQNDLRTALTYLEKAYNINPKYKPTLILAIEIHKRQGNMEQAAQLMQTLNSLP